MEAALWQHAALPGKALLHLELHYCCALLHVPRTSRAERAGHARKTSPVPLSAPLSPQDSNLPPHPPSSPYSPFPAQIMMSVAERGERPEVPDAYSRGVMGGAFAGIEGYVRLMRACWEQDPAQRPGFDQASATPCLLFCFGFSLIWVGLVFFVRVCGLGASRLRAAAAASLPFAAPCPGRCLADIGPRAGCPAGGLPRPSEQRSAHRRRRLLDTHACTRLAPPHVLCRSLLPCARWRSAWQPPSPARRGEGGQCQDHVNIMTLTGYL